MSTIHKKLLAFLPAFGTTAIAFAAEKTTANAGTGGNFNPVLVSLVTLMVILVFAIGILAGVVKNLAFAYRDKQRAKRNNNPLKTLLLLIAFSAPAAVLYAQETEAATAAVATRPEIIAGMPAFQFYFIIGIICLELFIALALVLLIRGMIRLITANPELVQSPAAQDALRKVKKTPFWDRFNRAVAVEQEEDIVLEHDYDGIRELDNSLPPWWKYGFYVTIVVAVVYLWYYHAGGGPSSYDEYVAEVKAGEAAKDAYLLANAGNIDESNVEMSDAAGIEEGKNLFAKNCAACHAADGGGIVGPNLTDDYWLHGGSLPDVFKSIKYGWADKGMKAWKDDFSPKQIASIASFIKTLRGTKPAAPKEQQGELYAETNDAPATDTTKAASAGPVALH